MSANELRSAKAQVRSQIAAAQAKLDAIADNASYAEVEELVSRIQVLNARAVRLQFAQ
jgi:hypothetical protein